MSVTTHEVRASRTATPVLVQATEPVPGLHVYVYPEELRATDDTYLWRLGHHSGLQIAKFEHQVEAESAAELISSLADWTRPADELRAIEHLGSKVASRICCETPGIFTTNAEPLTAETTA